MRAIKIVRVDGSVVTPITEVPAATTREILVWALHWRQGHQRRGAEVMPMANGMQAYTRETGRLDFFYTEPAVQ